MGVKHVDDEEYIKTLRQMKADGIIFDQGYMTSELKYDTDWNWLMPVIESCRESQIFGSQRLITNIDNRLLKLDILGVHANVVEFIEFYNQNKSEKS